MGFSSDPSTEGPFKALFMTFGHVRHVRMSPADQDQGDAEPHAPYVNGGAKPDQWGFIDVAFVINTFAHRILGWRVSRTAHASFVLDTQEQALHGRRPIQDDGLVHHSERNVQRVEVVVATP